MILSSKFNHFQNLFRREFRTLAAMQVFLSRHGLQVIRVYTPTMWTCFAAIAVLFRMAGMINFKSQWDWAIKPFIKYSVGQRWISIQGKHAITIGCYLSQPYPTASLRDLVFRILSPTVVTVNKPQWLALNMIKTRSGLSRQFGFLSTAAFTQHKGSIA